MGSEWFERDSDYVLLEGQSTDELQAPLNRSSRLKYNCVSVSNKLVAFGSNTGGIYIFSRIDQKLLQIAFAEKETNSVSLVRISPHEKYVAFVSSSNIYVLDLKLESRSKAETLRSSSDLAGCLVTSLLWDQTSAKLFIGDDLGKVSMMPVYSNKAKNLFSLPLEIIMKLDSAIVQLDKAEDKILVSTMTRCYLCDTVKQHYSQIGKKLRDGNFGACFLQQGTSAPMIYSARPGSRIWEVDFEGNVLNTHQFKQLLALPPSHIINVNQKYIFDTETNTTKAQSVAFPKLIILKKNFLLTWTNTSVYVLDPINVKVMLWTNQFS
ncbi:BLOC-2 complex member HPS5-like, partial [Ruditapes philippinarum]|uniref:BLOC-2 complex member HPS5-like n=1 Tax=Ruditapes philippinarum TaxID=129788 RepID=UPI00295AEBA0